MENRKRQLSKAKGGYTTSLLSKEYNTFRKVSFCSSEFIKCPVNIGETLKWNSTKGAWKEFRLYTRYLDLKAQSPNTGTFRIKHSPRYYQRTIKQLIAKGWAWRDGRTVYLKAYQHVWRDLGIGRVQQKHGLKFKYWKIPVSLFSDQRKIYLKEIEVEIRKRIAKRKLAQIRWALKQKGKNEQSETFSAKSAGTTFGYRSPSTGSKLRQIYFEVLPMSEDELRPKFSKERGRYEVPTKKIAI